MPASELIRFAREFHGLSQRELAVKSGIPQPRIADIESERHEASFSRIEELLTSVGFEIALVPGPQRGCWGAAAGIRESLQAGRLQTAWRHVIQLSDNLLGVDPATAVASNYLAPPSTGDLRYDSLIAAVVDYRLSERRLPVARWVDEPKYVLSEPWDVEPIASLRAAARRATPPEIKRHGIFLAKSELASV